MKMAKQHKTPSKFYEIKVKIEVDPAFFLNEEDMQDWLQDRIDELMPTTAGLRDSAGCHATEISSF